MTLANILSALAIVMTSIGICFSLYNSNRQIKNSNNQKLFDRRLNIFMISEEFSNILEQSDFSNNLKKNKDDFILLYSNNFREMINTVSLNKLWKVIPNSVDIKSPSTLHDDKVRNDFLETKAKFISLAKEAKFVFEEPENKIISKFITDYISLIDGYRLYDIEYKDCMESEKRYRESSSSTQITTEDYLKNMRPEIFRYQEEYISKPANELLNSYNKYKENLKKIENQIKLN